MTAAAANAQRIAEATGRFSAGEVLLGRIEAEVAAGRAWRAKEIVRGTISDTWPVPEVIERYGQILSTLGDQVEAGKYLWLSGVRCPAYEQAIGLFLHRHGRQGRAVLLAQLPKSLRRVAFDQLPPELQKDLGTRGIKAGDFGRRTRREDTPPPGRAANWMASALALGFLVCLIVGAGVGFRAIVLWVARALR